MEYVKEFVLELVYLFNEMSPYLLLGFLLAGVLHVYFPKDKVQKYLGRKSFKSVVNSALLGVPLPLCSCGVIPTGVSFHKNGASKGASISFLISTPQTGVDSVLATYSLLGLPFALIRPVVAFITGVVGGQALNLVDDETPNPKKPQVLTDSLKTDNKFKRMLHYAFVDFLADIAKWLVIGLLIAALITVLIPNGFFEQYLSNPYINMLIVLGASIPMYVCATGSIPIAAALMMKGISPGAAFVFLMAGPATNAGTITVIGQSLGKRALFTYMISIMVGALIAGALINSVMPADWFLLSTMLEHGHGSHLIPSWLSYSSSILLTALILNVFFRQIKNKYISKTPKTMDTTFKIDGMTCNHCKASVEKNLTQLEGINAVEVNLERKEAHVKGSKIDEEAIRKTVSELGYDFIGK